MIDFAGLLSIQEIEMAKRKRIRPPKPERVEAEPSGVVVITGMAEPKPKPEPDASPPKRDIFEVEIHETIPRSGFKRELTRALNEQRSKGREFFGSIESNHVAFVMFRDIESRGDSR